MMKYKKTPRFYEAFYKDISEVYGEDFCHVSEFIITEIYVER